MTRVELTRPWIFLAISPRFCWGTSGFLTPNFWGPNITAQCPSTWLKEGTFWLLTAASTVWLLTTVSGWWFQPLWKIWKSVGIITPNGKIKHVPKHVPNHQPVVYWLSWGCNSSSYGTTPTGSNHPVGPKHLLQNPLPMLDTLQKNKFFAG